MAIRTMGSGAAGVFSTILQTVVDREVLGGVLTVEYALYTLAEAASATDSVRVDDAGFNTHVLALFTATLGVLCAAFWG